MDIVSELHMIPQVLIAFLLGALIGWERERHGQVAGIRTFGAIAIGACVFGLISTHGTLGFGGGDPTRIASNVVVGVGFLGAGLIFHREQQVGGLTTAATLWATAAVGLAVAFTMYTIAVLVTLIMVLVLWLPRMPGWNWISPKGKKSKTIT
jgi:putative Mg2+ transporter-C (MgtC) family protein